MLDLKVSDVFFTDSLIAQSLGLVQVGAVSLMAVRLSSFLILINKIYIPSNSRGCALLKKSSIDSVSRQIKGEGWQPRLLCLCALGQGWEVLAWEKQTCC